jgi:large subunit ribosomal protein L22
MWPRARGRADRLLKRTCHISVVLDEIARRGE